MYKLTFEDDITFFSSSFNSKWNQMPDKKIKKLEYKIDNKTITFEGFEAYNHLVEKVCFIQGSGKEQITNIILMGRTGDLVQLITYNLKTKKIEKSETPFGQEYYKKSTTGWKKGLATKNPNIEIK